MVLCGDDLLNGHYKALNDNRKQMHACVCVCVSVRLFEFRINLLDSFTDGLFRYFSQTN